MKLKYYIGTDEESKKKRRLYLQFMEDIVRALGADETGVEVMKEVGFRRFFVCSLRNKAIDFSDLSLSKIID